MSGESGMTEFDRFVAAWLEDDGPQDVRAELVEAGIVGASNARQHRGLEGAVFGSGAWPRPRIRRTAVCRSRRSRSWSPSCSSPRPQPSSSVL